MKNQYFDLHNELRRFPLDARIQKTDQEEMKRRNRPCSQFTRMNKGAENVCFCGNHIPNT